MRISICVYVLLAVDVRAKENHNFDQLILNLREEKVGIWEV